MRSGLGLGKQLRGTRASRGHSGTSDNPSFCPWDPSAGVRCRSRTIDAKQFQGATQASSDRPQSALHGRRCTLVAERSACSASSRSRQCRRLRVARRPRLLSPGAAVGRIAPCGWLTRNVSCIRSVMSNGRPLCDASTQTTNYRLGACSENRRRIRLPRQVLGLAGWQDSAKLRPQPAASGTRLASALRLVKGLEVSHRPAEADILWIGQGPRGEGSRRVLPYLLMRRKRVRTWTIQNLAVSTCNRLAFRRGCR